MKTGAVAVAARSLDAVVGTRMEGSAPEMATAAEPVAGLEDHAVGTQWGAAVSR